MPLTASQIARFDRGAPTEGLGTLLNELEVEIESLEADVAALEADVAALATPGGNGIALMKVVYDFSVDGGAIGSYPLVDENGDPAVLPIKAILARTWSDVITTFAQDGAPGVCQFSLTAQTAGDITGGNDVETFLAGINDLAFNIDGDLLNMVKLTAARTVTATIADANVTAGKIVIFIEYIVSL